MLKFQIIRIFLEKYSHIFLQFWNILSQNKIIFKDLYFCLRSHSNCFISKYFKQSFEWKSNDILCFCLAILYIFILYSFKGYSKFCFKILKVVYVCKTFGNIYLNYYLLWIPSKIVTVTEYAKEKSFKNCTLYIIKDPKNSEFFWVYLK